MDFGFYILILGNVITLYKRYTFCSLDKVAQTSFLGLPTWGAPSVKQATVKAFNICFGDKGN